MKTRSITAAAAAVALTTGAGVTAGAAAQPASVGVERGAAPILVDRLVQQADESFDITTLWWQQELNTWLSLTGSDLYPVPEDGFFGEATVAATEEFQDTYDRLATTGTVSGFDRVTLEEAINHIRVHGAETPPVGFDITTVFWQEALNSWLSLTGSDLYPVPEDGFFGESTEAATLHFQNSYPGLEATGTVSGLDRVAIESAIEHLR